jgi:hypothetical protein
MVGPWHPVDLMLEEPIQERGSILVQATTDILDRGGSVRRDTVRNRHAQRERFQDAINHVRCAEGWYEKGKANANSIEHAGEYETRA